MNESLIQSEELFRKAFITSPDAVNINRLSDGLYVSVNEGFTTVTGYSAEEIIGKTSLELEIWEDPKYREKLVNGLKAEGKVSNMEARFRKKDGTIIDGLMSAALIELNGVTHILSITRDTTERKRTENALKESETRYREIIELAVDGILLGAPDGTITTANSYMVNLTGRRPDQLIGKNVSTLFPSEILNESPLRYDLLVKGETVINERKIIHKDGHLVPVEMHTKMMPDGSYQSIYHDITSRKESEKALMESEEWFRTLFEQSTDGIIYITLDGKILTVNKSFAEMHGYSTDELVGIDIDDLDCPETRQQYPERMKQIQKGSNLKFEVEHFHRDGHRIPLEVTAGLITMGSKNYILAAHRDIAERLKVEKEIKVARDKAEASDRIKTSFLNNISHEVRTPLNGIMGFAEIISRDDLSASDRQEALSMVYESSNRLMETITNYMDRSLLVSGEMTVKKTEFSPESCLKDFYKKLKPLCSAKNLALVFDIPELPYKPILNNDPELLHKIFNQLLNNAVKFTEKGEIHFGYKVQQDYFLFYVSDTGIGIGKESLSSIFDHFVKEEFKDRSNEGSGLGLSISKDLVSLLGGELMVESEKGKGSKFYFSLPIESNKKNFMADAAISDTSKVKILSSILIAEDDNINFLYIKALLLKNISAEILHAENGREAIEMFSKNEGIDLVLMDMKMPEIDGFEATRRIKLLKPSVPVIAITAYAMLGDEKRIMESGCDGYLCKPITGIRLLEKIGEVVKI
jgi:PAS domain S-box-containing protein